MLRRAEFYRRDLRADAQKTSTPTFFEGNAPADLRFEIALCEGTDETGFSPARNRRICNGRTKS
jgi:hypothetical protein